MRRPTVILLALFLLLAGITWVLQQPDNFIKKAFSPTATQALEELLVTPNNGMISVLEIKDANGKTFVLDNRSGSWSINDGKQGPADQNRSETAISLLYTLRILTRLETAPDPQGTGLNKPAYSVNVQQEVGPNSFTIGKLSPTGNGYYVQAMDGKVFIISKDGVEALIQNLDNPPLIQKPTPTATKTP